MLEKLKQRWGLKSNWDVLAILVVFSINGTLASKVADPVTGFFGVSKETTEPVFVYWILRILLIFPIYQFTLPLVGWCFGQFKFFWAFEKKMLSRFGIKLGK